MLWWPLGLSSTFCLNLPQHTVISSLNFYLHHLKCPNKMHTTVCKNSCNEWRKNLQFFFFLSFFRINLSNHAKKTTPNQADNITIFQTCLLPKMRLSVVLDSLKAIRLRILNKKQKLIFIPILLRTLKYKSQIWIHFFYSSC